VDTDPGRDSRVRLRGTSVRRNSLLIAWAGVCGRLDPSESSSGLTGSGNVDRSSKCRCACLEREYRAVDADGLTLKRRSTRVAGAWPPLQIGSSGALLRTRPAHDRRRRVARRRPNSPAGVVRRSIGWRRLAPWSRPRRHPRARTRRRTTAADRRWSAVLVVKPPSATVGAQPPSANTSATRCSSASWVTRTARPRASRRSRGWRHRKRSGWSRSMFYLRDRELRRSSSGRRPRWRRRRHVGRRPRRLFDTRRCWWYRSTGARFLGQLVSSVPAPIGSIRWARS